MRALLGLVFKSLDQAFDKAIARELTAGDLETCADPFCDLASDRERTILVLEVGSAVFSAFANPLFASFGETDYFTVHDEGDATHKNMGVNLLGNLDEESYTGLEQVQRQGWDMLNLLCARLAELARA
jgi:hypothetical protein